MIALAVTNECVDERISDEYNSLFLCPDNTVIVGRHHKGDERESTTYRYGRLEFLDAAHAENYEILMGEARWSVMQKESASDFRCENGHVIIGRKHDDDENGQTQYLTCSVTVRPKRVDKKAYDCSFTEEQRMTFKESEGKWAEYAKTVDGIVIHYPMIARAHSGDENGNTTMTFAKLYVPNV